MNGSGGTARIADRKKPQLSGFFLEFKLTVPLHCVYFGESPQARSVGQQMNFNAQNGFKQGFSNSALSADERSLSVGQAKSASVDTPSYESFTEHGFEAELKGLAFKSLDRETGELIKYHRARTGDYTIQLTADEHRLNSMIEKSILRDTASRLLWNKDLKGASGTVADAYDQHKVCKCHKVSYVKRDPSERIALGVDAFGKGQVSGIVKCGKSWLCGECAAKINEHKGAELRDMLQKALERDYKVELFNFTIPHYKDDDLGENLDAQKAALEDFWRSGVIKRFKKSPLDLPENARIKKEGCDFIGRVSALEFTWSSANGWHPHYHIMVISKHGSKGWKSDLLDCWQQQLKKHSLEPKTAKGWENFHRALVIQDGEKAGEYILKYGSDDESKLTAKGKVIRWDMADEITKQNIKSGRAKSLAPFDFLREIKNPDVSYQTKKHYKKLFREFAKITADRQLNHCRWSAGLRKHFDITNELTDQEIVDSSEHVKKDIAFINSDEWSMMQKLKENVSVNLRVLASRQFQGTDENHVLPLYIYDRTQQKITFSDYLAEFNTRINYQNEAKDSPELTDLENYNREKIIKTPEQESEDIRRLFENYNKHNSTHWPKRSISQYVRGEVQKGDIDPCNHLDYFDTDTVYDFFNDVEEEFLHYKTNFKK